ncbi:MAG: hypothetical protein MZV64_23285 [Ignavibacteriales bacterium]|nr:hypothetical protein [Ignavibacteriales bacterium]
MNYLNPCSSIDPYYRRCLLGRRGIDDELLHRFLGAGRDSGNGWSVTLAGADAVFHCHHGQRVCHGYRGFPAVWA